MQPCHILNLISAKHADVSFHTPGHKMDADYCRTIPMAGMDTTELSYTDDLSSPTGAIAAAQRDVAKIVGAGRSYILTDGSTSGVMAMVYAAKSRGKKLIVVRNCHKSVWNACAILGVQPIVVTGKVVDGVMQPPAPEQIDRILCADESVCGVMVTSPDYYGNIAPLAQYSRILKEHGKMLLVDGAHGGHLAFEEGRQGYAGVYADIWVDGVHKSMPALTQGALLHLNTLALEERVEEGLNIFRTTSPSFPIMASVEYSVKYCDGNGGKICEIKSAAEAARRRIKSCGYGVYSSCDWTKLAVDCSPLNIDTQLACDYLESGGIYAEFNDGRYILFYISVMTREGDLDKLCNALADVRRWDKLRATEPPAETLNFTETVNTDYLRAVHSPCEYIQLNDAEGRLCAANAGISPPCIPLVTAGERITSCAIGALKGARHTFGLKDGKIKVVKDEG